MLPYAVTIFAGAFLLFQVQPLIAKYILPWFGGGPAVWSACMLFFQALLLGGYAYAHLSMRRFRPHVQAAVHLALLAGALTQLRITPADTWKPVSVDTPSVDIVVLLLASIGLPFMVLSSTTPLMQAWCSQEHPGRSPYRLYALSNVASLLALLSYPFVVEPMLARPTQATVWALGFGFFVVGSGYCAVRVWRRGAPDETRAVAPPAPDVALTRGTYALWLLLPAYASVLLLAVTNQITLDVAPIPFMWVLPLSLYLLTFVIAFDNEQWYSRGVFTGALVPTILAVLWVLFGGDDIPIVSQVVALSAALFVCCMVCHGELSRLRPDPRHLTGYYLMIALGGALGGAFVALIAPRVFSDYLELHLGLAAVCALTLTILFTDRRSPLFRGRPVLAWGVLVAACLVLVVALSRHASQRAESAITRARNFYGVLSVLRFAENTPDEYLVLRHGVSPHGLQFTSPDRRRLATGYYAANSGVGLTLSGFPRPGQRQIGLVGLGAGTIATLTRAGDHLRIYEINPAVQQAAETTFTYLADSPAQTEVVLGDARLSLEREAPRNFDILILDAFTSDAIPVHLLTREAFEIYLRHLEPDGVIAVLISSRYFDFEPVLRALAVSFGMDAVRTFTGQGPEGDWGSEWMLLTKDRAFLSSPLIARADAGPWAEYDPMPLWTDNYTSLWPILIR